MIVTKTNKGSTEGSSNHRVFDQLVHNIAENSETVVNRNVTSGDVESVVIYTDSSHTTKIREVVLSRNVNDEINTITVYHYDGSGIIAETLISSITRNLSGEITSIDNVLS